MTLKRFVCIKWGKNQNKKKTNLKHSRPKQTTKKNSKTRNTSVCFSFFVSLYPPSRVNSYSAPPFLIQALQQYTISSTISHSKAFNA